MKFELSMIDFEQNSKMMVIWENTLFHMNLIKSLPSDNSLDPGLFNLIRLPGSVIFLFKIRNS